jgi:hypothetical protein
MFKFSFVRNHKLSFQLPGARTFPSALLLNRPWKRAGISPLQLREFAHAATPRSHPGAAPFLILLLILSLLVLAGCQTTRPWAPLDLSTPDWSIQHGQIVWQPQSDAPDLAGELILATHPDGRSMVQFSKNPFPILSAQTGPDGWQISFNPENRTVTGRGRPPARFIWLRLPGILEGENPPRNWSFERLDPTSWKLRNRVTGEQLEGYLSENIPPGPA